MQQGFIKVGCAVPEVKVCDCKYNADQILNIVEQANSKGVKVLLFPELSLTGYTCGDLFNQHSLLEAALEELNRIKSLTHDIDMVIAVGLPIALGSKLYNVAVLFHKARILAAIPKTYIPHGNEYYEQRWFSSACESGRDQINVCGQVVPFGTNILIQEKNNSNLVISSELCEDLWAPVAPSSIHAVHGATLLLNLSASNETVGKNLVREQLIANQSFRTKSCYIYASAGLGESTTDLVYSGYAAIAEAGNLVETSERFSFQGQLLYADIDLDRLIHERKGVPGFTLAAPFGTSASYRTISFSFEAATNEAGVLKREVKRNPFIPDGLYYNPYSEALSLQAAALSKKLSHLGDKKVIIGVSGGLDSTLALFACVQAIEKLHYDRSQIIGVTMPGPGTTKRTLNNSKRLMQAMGIQMREISIDAAVMQHFANIGHDPACHDITYEQAQSRERTKILMDLSNKENGIVIGTGDMSELALGWMTYSGDQMSMYAINSGIPKTVIKLMVQWLADTCEDGTVKSILLNILDTPISPELLPPGPDGVQAQKTEDLVGPYELHDFFLYYIVRYGYTPEKIICLAKQSFGSQYSVSDIRKWLKLFYSRFFTRQFKRTCFPDGPQIFPISLSPRGYWRMPSDACFQIWVDKLDRMDISKYDKATYSES